MRDFDHACFRALAAEPRAVGCSAVRRFGPREQTEEAKVDHGASDQALTRHITWIAASFGGWSANPSPFFMAPACAGRAVTKSWSSAELRIVSGVYRVAAGTLQPKQSAVFGSRGPRLRSRYVRPAKVRRRWPATNWWAQQMATVRERRKTGADGIGGSGTREWRSGDFFVVGEGIGGVSPDPGTCVVAESRARAR